MSGSRIKKIGIGKKERNHSCENIYLAFPAKSWNRIRMANVAVSKVRFPASTVEPGRFLESGARVHETAANRMK